MINDKEILLARVFYSNTSTRSADAEVPFLVGVNLSKKPGDAGELTFSSPRSSVVYLFSTTANLTSNGEGS